jgi:hypothetical protein
MARFALGVALTTGALSLWAPQHLAPAAWAASASCAAYPA